MAEGGMNESKDDEGLKVCVSVFLCYRSYVVVCVGLSHSTSWSAYIDFLDSMR